MEGVKGNRVVAISLQFLQVRSDVTFYMHEKLSEPFSKQDVKEHIDVLKDLLSSCKLYMYFLIKTLKL